MAAGVLHGGRQVLEQMLVVAQRTDHADVGHQGKMIRPDSLQEHRDAAQFQGGDDLHECVRAGGVKHP